MSDNQNPQIPQYDLTKCCECKKPFENGQKYWELKDKRNNKVAMNSCLPCWDNWLTTEKTWQNSNPNQLPPADKCCDCQKSFIQGQRYRGIKKEGKYIMNFCLECWNKYTHEEYRWESEQRKTIWNSI
jgi:hypothetical protein